MGITEQIRQEIEKGRPQDAAELVKCGLEAGIEPGVIVNEALLPAMRTVGQYYKSDNSDIPRLLTAARGVRKSFEVIERDYQGFSYPKIGKIILGTVEGDLHDIGKNLVGLMFRSVGFEVIDLGVDVSGKQFLKAVQEHPDVFLVCISALLSTSIPQLKRVVKALQKDSKRKYKIMIGGGAVSRELAESLGADAYTENAVDAAELAKAMLEEEQAGRE